MPTLSPEAREFLARTSLAFEVLPPKVAREMAEDAEKTLVEVCAILKEEGMESAAWETGLGDRILDTSDHSPKVEKIRDQISALPDRQFVTDSDILNWWNQPLAERLWAKRWDETFITGAFVLLREEKNMSPKEAADAVRKTLAMYGTGPSPSGIDEDAFLPWEIRTRFNAWHLPKSMAGEKIGQGFSSINAYIRYLLKNGELPPLDSDTETHQFVATVSNNYEPQGGNRMKKEGWPKKIFKTLFYLPIAAGALYFFGSFDDFNPSNPLHWIGIHNFDLPSTVSISTGPMLKAISYFGSFGKSRDKKSASTSVQQPKEYEEIQGLLALAYHEPLTMANKHLAKAVALARQSGDRSTIVNTLGDASSDLSFKKSFQQADAYLEEALSLTAGTENIERVGALICAMHVYHVEKRLVEIFSAADEVIRISKNHPFDVRSRLQAFSFFQAHQMKTLAFIETGKKAEAWKEWAEVKNTIDKYSVGKSIDKREFKETNAKMEVALRAMK